MNLQLLLPRTLAPIDFKMFVTHLPMFNQSFGNLGPHVAFRKLELAGSDSAVTVGVRPLSPLQLAWLHTYFL